MWLVNFSCAKTKGMLISTRNIPNLAPLTFGGENLEEVTEHKHLGLTLTNNFTWTSHIDATLEKAGKRIDMMARLGHKLDRKTLDLMYKTFVRPTMEYACVIWDGCTQKNH